MPIYGAFVSIGQACGQGAANRHAEGRVLPHQFFEVLAVENPQIDIVQRAGVDRAGASGQQ